MSWIINGNVKFSPEEKRLSSLTDPTLSATLTTPASNCLSLLLEAFPEMVNQKDLFHKVWQEDGMHVTVNTLYQNISLIRRGLRKAGATEASLIITVPRKGFRIDGRISLSRIANEPLPQTPVPEEQPPVTGSQPYRRHTVPVHRDDTFLPCAARANVNVHGWRQTLAPFIMLTAFCLGTFATEGAIHYTGGTDFYRNYRLFRTENGCRYYSDTDDITGRHLFTRVKNKIISTGLDCKKYPFIYFPSFTAHSVVSVLTCKKENYHGCITLYFRDINNVP